MMDIHVYLDLLADKLKSFSLKKNDRNRKLRSEIALRIAAEILTDDERAEAYGLPDGCRIREGAKILSRENLKMGRRCWIGENAVLDASGGLTIGSDCSIGLSVFIWTHSSHLTTLTGANEIGSPLIMRRQTTIGNGVFIAGPSVILPGAVIGDNVVVRPFSTVSGTVPPNALFEGTSFSPDVFTPERVSRMVQRHVDTPSG